MRTTLNIKDKVLKNVVKLTGASTKSAAVNGVLEDYVRRERQKEIKNLFGKIRIDYDWKKAERAELQDQKRRQKLWRSS